MPGLDHPGPEPLRAADDVPCLGALALSHEAGHRLGHVGRRAAGDEPVVEGPHRGAADDRPVVPHGVGPVDLRRALGLRLQVRDPGVPGLPVCPRLGGAVLRHVGLDDNRLAPGRLRHERRPLECDPGRGWDTGASLDTGADRSPGGAHLHRRPVARIAEADSQRLTRVPETHRIDRCRRRQPERRTRAAADAHVPRGVRFARASSMRSSICVPVRTAAAFLGLHGSRVDARSTPERTRGKRGRPRPPSGPPGRGRPRVKCPLPNAPDRGPLQRGNAL